MSRIIVTGGAGFIGSAVVWRLNDMGRDDILVVDRMDETDKWKNLAPLKFADYIEAVDFLDVIDDLDDVEAVLHLGACSSTTERDADFMIRNNYQYTKELAEWSVANDVRFIYASSAATYGDGSAGMEDGTESLHRLRPLNVYGYSKHLFDLYAARSEMFDRVVGLKYFNVFGPRQDPSSPYSGVISLFISALCDGRQPKIYGDGEHTRDFTFVANVVDGVLKACHAPKASGEVINVATGGRISLNHLFTTVRDFVGAKVEPIYADPRAGDVKDSQADISKAKALLGYTPIVSFEDGLKQTVEWYRSSMTTA